MLDLSTGRVYKRTNELTEGPQMDYYASNEGERTQFSSTKNLTREIKSLTTKKVKLPTLTQESKQSLASLNNN